MKTTHLLLLIPSLLISLTFLQDDTAVPASPVDSTSQWDRIPSYCAEGEGGTRVHTGRPQFKEMNLFKAGMEGYHSFRVPAIVSTRRGTLLAFCEGRKNSGEDYGDIDVVYKRSTNNGTSWSPLKVLFSVKGGTCGSPTAVADMINGRICVIMSYNDRKYAERSMPPEYEAVDEWGERRVFLNWSDDDGLSWDNLQDLTKELLPRNYTWDAIGPGAGIQLRHGPKAGRLIIPALGRNLFSDNHGLTWQQQQIRSGTSEGTIMQLCNGDLLRNDRGDAGAFKARRRRQISISSNNGNSWSSWRSSNDLLDPLCQASLLRYNDSYPQRLLFLNPATTLPGLPNRKKMSVKISYDDGITWPVERILDPNNGGYSSMAKTENGHIASLQEARENNNTAYTIKFRRFNLPWILNGEPEPVQ
ncbi:MAG: exo-alpha-sialidase [Saprospiraceae bacterium]|nr:exo-alpha-sialidase [Saprospiraceae bacterium]